MPVTKTRSRTTRAPARAGKPGKARKPAGAGSKAKARRAATNGRGRASGAGPTGLTIRSYQVGFGDCFLLTFHYPAPRGGNAGDGDRHVLIDFGSTGLPKKGVTKDQMDRVAADIRSQCRGKLHAVVATHRHKDHISGFTTSPGGKATGDVIRGCKPELVLQPWTEDPDAAPDAKKPTVQLTGRQAMVRALGEMHGFAAQVVHEVNRRLARKEIGRDLGREIAFMGDDALPNRAAVDNLMTMGKRREYLSYGARTALADLLPGVAVTVLGPPTLEQSPAIEQERARDASEFWQFQLAAAGGGGGGGGRGAAAAGGGRVLFPHARHRGHGQRLPDYARWFAPRLDEIRGDQLLQIVRAMDDALNNTSLILLFEAGGKKFLFPGDAQIENWSYALNDAPDHKAVRAKLAQVDFYKVGHHGSLNATPKTLWGLFAKKSPKAKAPGRLCTAVSTMGGKHGKVSSGTEVPRGPLVEQLKEQSTFFCTEDLTEEPDPAKRLRYDITFKF